MNDPELHDASRRLARRAFPAYRGRRVRVDTSGRCLFSDLHWSDGRKSDFCAVALDSLQTSDIRPSALAPWDEKLEGETVDVPRGVVIVELRQSGSLVSVVVHFSKEDCS